MSSEPNLENILRMFIRGDEGDETLLRLGVQIESLASGTAVLEPPGMPVVRPSIADVARGLVVRWARTSTVKTYASLLLSLNCIDLVMIDAAGEGDGEFVLELLWSAAEGGDISLSVDRLSVLAAGGGAA